MRVLLLTGEFNPFNLGGIGRYVNKIFELMTPHDDIQMDVMNVMTYVKPYYTFPFKTMEKIQTKESTILHVDGKNSDTIDDKKEAMLIISQSIQHLFFPYDIIFVQDAHNARIVRQLIQKKLVAHVVFFVHLSTLYYEAHLPLTYQNPRILKKQKRCEKILQALSPTYIFPSQHTQQLVQLSNQNFSNSHVIPLAADTKLADSALCQLTHNKWACLQPLRLISVGRFAAQKAPFYLCDVIKHCRDFGLNFHITLIGTGDLTDETKARLKKENLSQYVTIITNHLNEEAIFSYLAKSHIFISTALFESFGFAILEAMASECVPVCFNNTAISELINSNEVGFLIENEKPKQMADKILSLAKKRKLMQKIANNAKQRANQYSWETHIKSLTQLFKSIGAT